MSVLDLAAKAQRSLVRETVGAWVRAKSTRADNAVRVAILANLRAVDARPLEREDFLKAARDWGLAAGDTEADLNAAARGLHALADAESGRWQGFDDRNRPTILVEPHIFSRLSKHAFDRSHPWLSYPVWTPWRKDAAPPAGFTQHPYSYDMDDRWGLMLSMAELDYDAACGSVSAGRFQQVTGSPRPDMGWKPLGFASAEALLVKLARSEWDQLEVLQIFLRANGLMSAFRERDWRRIARGYNGPGQVELYAARMAEAFKRRARAYA
jgi:hypothetical protein